MTGLLVKELKYRGLVRRTLIVVPGHLKDQWLREMKERFAETFTVIDRNVMTATWGRNIWHEQAQVITSMDFAKQDDVMATLGETRWDLVVVDEAHKMAAYRYGDKTNKTDRYRFGELVERLTAAETREELQAEIQTLGDLIRLARDAERNEVETKLNELRKVIGTENLQRTGEKLLIFTESRETLDYLVEKLKSWGYSVVSLHGGMNLDARIRAEHEFREKAQVMVSTEAGGEGINLQFCSLMVNYDIPWNPNRLEQRMGRIHRYGQQKEVHIYNLVASDTREGKVLEALFQKLERIQKALGSDRVFDVIGEVIPGRSLKDLIVEAIAQRRTLDEIVAEIEAVPDNEAVDKTRQAASEALATRHIDLSRILGETRRAKGEPIPDVEIRNEERRKEELLARKQALEDEIRRETSLLPSAPKVLGLARVLPQPSADPAMRSDRDIEAIGNASGHGLRTCQQTLAGRCLKPKPRLRHPLGRRRRRHPLHRGQSTRHHRRHCPHPQRMAHGQRLGDEYWLYIVENARTQPILHTIQNPATNWPHRRWWRLSDMSSRTGNHEPRHLQKQSQRSRDPSRTRLSSLLGIRAEPAPATALVRRRVDPPAFGRRPRPGRTGRPRTHLAESASAHPSIHPT
jgi:superfamily II DNA/RNA helicase